LVKKGDPGALALLGFAGNPKVKLENARFSPRRLRIGEKLEFSFELASAANKPQDLLVDFAVHFVKSNGRAAPKVFKLARVKLPPRTRQRLAGSVSFKAMTTRKHYPGLHAIDVLVNGAVFRLGQVRVAG
jgi:hypothetical protein